MNSLGALEGDHHCVPSVPISPSKKESKQHTHKIKKKKEEGLSLSLSHSMCAEEKNSSKREQNIDRRKKKD